MQATVKHICFDLRCYILKSPPRHPNETMCLLLTLLIQIAEDLAGFAQKALLFARIQPHLEMVRQFYTRNHPILGLCDTLFAIGTTNLFLGQILELNGPSKPGLTQPLDYQRIFCFFNVRTTFATVVRPKQSQWLQIFELTRCFFAVTVSLWLVEGMTLVSATFHLWMKERHIHSASQK